MAGPGNILIKIGAEAGQAVRELGTVDKALGSTMTTSEKMGAGLKKAALPAAAALTAIGVAAFDATKAAAEDAAAQEHLAGVMKRTAGATDAQVKATEDWISKTSLATGVADDDLRPALENLLTATGSVAESQKEMTAAMDISAASGKDLETVTKAMALAHQGQTSKLAKLIPGISAAARESKDYDVIMAELAKTTGGAMAQSTETAAGQFKIFQNQTAELKESLGAALLPVVQALVPWLNKLAEFAAKNTTAIKILVGVVAGLSAAILAANAVMKVATALQTLWTVATKAAAVATRAYTAAQWLLNAAMDANPIGAVIVAVVALTTAIIIAYKRSETFREVVQGAMRAVIVAFQAVRAAAAAAFGWIADHWRIGLFAFGPIGAALYLIVTRFDQIQAAAVRAFNIVTAAIQKVIDAVKTLLDLLGKIHVPKIHFPHIPGTLVIPPTAGFALSPAGRAAGAGAASGAGGITVNVFGAVDPEGTARAIRRILERHDRRQGRIV